MNRCIVCERETEDAVCECGCATKATDVGVADDVSLGEGGTSLVESSVEAEADSLLLKDEGSNPTGSVHDRGAAAYLDHGAPGTSTLKAPSTGDSAVSLAAYAARADVDFEGYVPSRARFDVKAMVNVYGGDMKVVRGRYDEARQRFHDEDGEGVPQEAPEYVAGLSGICTELPSCDHVVVPVASGALLTAVLSSCDATVHGVQPEGCMPFVDSVDAGEYVACNDPDTVVGECEVPEPPAAFVDIAVALHGDGDLEMHRVEDGEALDRCLDVARRDGVDLSPAGGAAVAAAEELCGEVVAVNPASGRLSADALRNRLVYHGE